MSYPGNPDIKSLRHLDTLKDVKKTTGLAINTPVEIKDVLKTSRLAINTPVKKSDMYKSLVHAWLNSTNTDTEKLYAHKWGNVNPTDDTSDSSDTSDIDDEELENLCGSDWTNVHSGSGSHDNGATSSESSDS